MNAANSEAPLVFLIAGEPSGDGLGAKLMAALKRATGGRLRFAGIGGERMIGEGLRSLFPMTDLSVMGLAEVLPRLPRLARRLRETVAAIGAQRPDVVVTIDAPSFCFRVAHRIRGLGVPVVHYVAPQLWAWRPERAKSIAREVDHLMVILPFEPEFFTRFNLKTTYVGHPVIEDGAGEGDGQRFRARHGLAGDATLVAVLPGSRLGEVGRLGPVFGEALARLRARVPGLVAVVPVVAGTDAAVTKLIEDWSVPSVILRDRAEKYDAYAAASAALTSSGTATLELALARLPMVVAYRVNAITGFLARRLITVRHVALPNLIVDRGIAPELLQDQCRPDRIAETLGQLLADPAARAAQQAGLAEVAARLAIDHDRPSDRAARVVLGAISRFAHRVPPPLAGGG